jgi:hypothetical protein
MSIYLISLALHIYTNAMEVYTNCYECRTRTRSCNIKAADLHYAKPSSSLFMAGALPDQVLTNALLVIELALHVDCVI